MRIPAFVALLVLACVAQAQPWPSKPVRVVIPWPPARLGSEIVRIMQGSDMRERFINAGLEPAAMGADEALPFIKRNIERYGEIARAANIRID